MSQRVRDVEEWRVGEKHKERAEGKDELWRLAALSSVIYRLAHLVGGTFIGYFPRKLLIL